LLNRIKLGCLLFLLSFLLASTSVAAALTSAEIDQKSINLLLAKLGVVALIDGIPDILKHGLVQKQQEQGIAKSQYRDNVTKIVNAYFSKEKLLNDVSARLMKTKLSPQFQNARYQSVLKLLTSNISVKLLALKDDARTSEAASEIQKLAALHDRTPLPKQRLLLLESYDNAAADTEFFVATQALSIDAILKITHAFRVINNKKVLPEKNQNVLSSTYQLLLRPSRYTTMMTLQYMFKQSSEQDIKQYILIYRQKQLQWLLQNTMLALSDVMQTATQQALDRIKKL